MLVDLDFALAHARGRACLNMDNCIHYSWNGKTLTTEWDFEGERLKMVETQRIAQGVYYSHDLLHVVNTHTLFQGVSPYQDKSRLFNAMREGLDRGEGHTARWERIRDRYDWRLGVPSYGSADNLKQIIHRGRHYLHSPLPYVLGVQVIDQERHGHWRWHKSGPYLGVHEALGEHLRDTPDIPYVLSFHWIRLVPYTLTARHRQTVTA